MSVSFKKEYIILGNLVHWKTLGVGVDDGIVVCLGIAESHSGRPYHRVAMKYPCSSSIKTVLPLTPLFGFATSVSARTVPSSA